MRDDIPLEVGRAILM